MKKFKMAVISVKILILTISVAASQQSNGSNGTNGTVKSEPKEEKEVAYPFPLEHVSPTFYRPKKEPEVSPTSSKTETVDISPKLAISDDEDTFWEVTKEPEDKMGKDFVDGNHPNSQEITTHEHVDKAVKVVAQSKRVKKILPPYQHSPTEGNAKRNTRNTKQIAAIKTSDLNHDKMQTRKKTNSSSLISDDKNNSKQTVETANKSLVNLNNINDVKYSNVETNKKDKESEIPLEKKNRQLTKKRINESRNYQKPEGYSKLNGIRLQGEASDNDVAQNINLVTPQTAHDPSFRQSHYLNHEIASKQAETDKKEQIKIQTLSPSYGSTSPSTRLFYGNTSESEQEIDGIRLVPDEAPSKRQKSTTERTIWDLLKERQNFKDGKSISPDKKTAGKNLYDHFDKDSEEIEYETENFQHGYSNIEKHELPFSYALPWLEIKDKQFDVRQKKKTEIKKAMVHTKINDFPNILPINKNHFEASQEMLIPRDVSKLLKMSEGLENNHSINGVTVSIVDSGTNNDDRSRYGHRPSKWYLLLLTGNSTIVKLRRKDFTKYLKLNLAARLSVEYDDIKVNRVILAPPKVLVNISVYAPSEDIAEESQFDLKEKFEDKGEAPLYKLAETNATLLELSGEEYHVVRFLSLQSRKPEMEKDFRLDSSVPVNTRHEDVEFVIYTFLGSACACAIILTLFTTLSKYFKKISELEWPWNKPKTAGWKVNHRSRPVHDEFNGVSPAVIYSGGFPQIRGSWMAGVGSRTGQTTDPPNYTPSILQQYPGIELGVSPPPPPLPPPHKKNASLYPRLEDKPHNSPRHNKLQIYNCGANNLVIPLLPQKEVNKAIDKQNDVSDSHPLDVRICKKKLAQDNPNFAN